jgi:signal peptidase I
MAGSKDELPLWRTLWSWIWPIAIGWLVAAGIMRYVVSFAVVPTASMAPTIPNPCYILVDHAATETTTPYRGEVVLFPFPDDPSQIYVKRIVGMPGETVTIHGGHVYINNQELSEPYLHGHTTPGDWGPYQVPPGHYFMLGDNRSVSEDSRYWTHKYVAGDTIIGRADLVVWPMAKWTTIH